jgi:hypothetical protein
LVVQEGLEVQVEGLIKVEEIQEEQEHQDKEMLAGILLVLEVTEETLMEPVVVEKVLLEVQISIKVEVQVVMVQQMIIVVHQ